VLIVEKLFRKVVARNDLNIKMAENLTTVIEVKRKYIREVYIMKFKFLIFLFSLLLVVALAGCSTEDVDKANVDNYRINIATATTGGAYYPAGIASAQIYKEFAGIEASASTSSGSVENVTLLANGEANIIAQQSDIFEDAYNGKGQFEGEPHKDMRIIVPIVSNTYNIVVRKDTGIKSMADFKGKKVVVGRAGSGTAVTTEKILSAFGINFDDIQQNNLGIDEAINAIRNGQADATIATGAPPLSAISDALASPGTNVMLYSLTPEEEKQIVDNFPYMAPMDIEPGIYPTLNEQVNAIGHVGYWAVNEDMPVEVAYKLVMAMYENKDKLLEAYGGFNGPSFLNPADAINALTVPLHPGAEKAFKELGLIN